MRVSMGFSDLTASLPTLWHRFALPSALTFLRICLSERNHQRDSYKDQVDIIRRSWVTETSAFLVRVNPASSCSVVMRWLLPSHLEAWEPRLSPGDPVKSAWCRPISMGLVLFMCPKQFEAYIKKEKDHCPGGVHRHLHEGNMFKQSCEAWSSEKNYFHKEMKKIQFRDYLTENWIYCNWHKILNFQNKHTRRYFYVCLIGR